MLNPRGLSREQNRESEGQESLVWDNQDHSFLLLLPLLSVLWG